MNTWYSLDLGDGVEAYEPTEKIQEAFMPIYSSAGCPKDMGVFSRYDLKSNIVTMYFTPKTHIVAKAFKATPCDKPTSEDLGLIVGDANCWDIFFPNRRK